ncbi:MAG: DinB family protein [Bryobacterales bacterium]|nr:DinB family protein [Bryobacterales bacterium]
MTKEAMLGEISALAEYFDRSTGPLTEGDSNYAPKEGLFTVAQVVAHVAQTVDWFIAGAFAAEGFSMDFEGMDKQVRAVTSLDHARQWFARSIAKAKTAVEEKPESEWFAPLPPGPIMGGLPRAAVLGACTDHTAHHRGALTVYTRLLGKVPPMPYMDM